LGEGYSIRGSTILLKNDNIYITQGIVDVASFDGNTKLDAECRGEGRKIIFVFIKNIEKKRFKKDML